MTGKRVSLLAVVCFLGVSATIALSSSSSRILDGEDADLGEFPHVVSVRVGNAHVGSGTIISPQHILTAAHFVSKLGTTPIAASSITVRSGSINQYAGGQISEVTNVTINSSYGNFLHDLAILTLAQPLSFTNKTQSIALAAADDLIEADDQFVVAGWGVHRSTASPYKLKKTVMNVVSRSECELEAGYGYGSSLCLRHAAGDGICRGDDGAGVLLDNVLVGVASFAFGNCGTAYPDIASLVSYYRQWIDTVMESS